MLAKFPFSDDTLKERAFLDPRNHAMSSSTTGIVNLATRFTSFSADDIDCLLMEFRKYRVAPNHQLPAFVPSDNAAMDHFWAAMGELRAIADFTDRRFGTLSKLAKILLVLHQMLILNGYSVWSERSKLSIGDVWIHRLSVTY